MNKKLLTKNLKVFQDWNGETEKESNIKMFLNGAWIDYPSYSGWGAEKLKTHEIRFKNQDCLEQLDNEGNPLPSKFKNLNVSERVLMIGQLNRGGELEYWDDDEKEWMKSIHSRSIDLSIEDIDLRYRVKTPEYRPFETIEEVKPFIDSLLREKQCGRIIRIHSIETSRLFPPEAELLINGTRAKWWFDNYVFDKNGKPFGVKL